MEYYKNTDLNDIIYIDDIGETQFEKWVCIKGYECKYMVSDLGRVKSKRNKHGERDLILKPNMSKCGYVRVRLHLNRKIKNIQIQRLVALNFIGEIPNGYCVDHINNISSDNRLINLQIITNRENSTKDRVNKTGFNNVSYSKKTNKYTSYIIINKTYYHLGTRDSPEEAYELYKKSLYEWENFNIIPKIKETSSKYKGVSLNKYGKYKVSIMIEKYHYYLGEYESEIEASEVYIKAKNNYKAFKILPNKEYKNPKNTYKYKNIIYYKPYNKWLSQYKNNGKLYFIGYFNTEDEAYIKQQEKIKEINEMEYEQ